MVSPVNGNVNVSSTVYGSFASYTCNVGYFVRGSGTRQCQHTGHWNGTQPSCEITGISILTRSYPNSRVLNRQNLAKGDLLFNNIAV